MHKYSSKFRAANERNRCGGGRAMYRSGWNEVALKWDFRWAKSAELSPILDWLEK